MTARAPANADGDHPAGVRMIREVRRRDAVVMKDGDLFDPPVAENAVVDYGGVTLEMLMVDGSSLSLCRMGPGDVLLDLETFCTPVFSLCYRADRPTRISWTRRPAFGARDAYDGMQELLVACMRRVHELACLQTAHRLYCELLRFAAEAPDGVSLVLPSQGQLALRLCTTRETISRELSFLRREGVLSAGREPRLLNRGFLVSTLSRALGVIEEADLLRSLGIRHAR
ncbi:helix-turn-helix domain-containing protein [Sphingomonas sp. Leaf412]|uniref:helix-turn-helix domain-containing protein n=1 Tax=Sphingomonas sp. Leaf412 TaxID=1736370 RepID=UPI001F39FF7F|nr:helix-turn-helix domain-containing protein [Sphingomonas sp. Leaf412]